MRPGIFFLGIFFLALGAAFAAPRPPNPPAPGFDLEGSDARAIQIADAVMEKLGGRAAWDRTRYVTWNFMGRRRHLWDRYTGRLRLEVLGPRTGKPYVMVLDVNSGKGRAWRDGQEVTDQGELAPMLEGGRQMWINDSYWLLMPYKLKDTGVTLRDLGEGQTQEGQAADVLELTFKDVGVTPRNKYHVWVARESGLIEQWAYFEDRDNPEPKFTGPWKGWARCGRIMLCGDHGELGGQHMELTGIAVLDEVPASAFERPDPVDWEALLKGR